jgi:hypothetical protein
MGKILFLFIFCVVLTQLKAQDLTITNITVIPCEDGSPTLKNQTVFIVDGRIKDIIPYKPQHAKNKLQTVIDGTGKYLIPGLADMHVHFPDPKEMTLERFFKLNLAAGVTTLRSMRGDSSHINLRDNINKGTVLAPKLYISTPLPSDSAVTALQLKEFVVKAKKENWDFVKYLSGLTPALFDSAALYCKQNKIKLAGHVFKSDINTALNISQASIEHYQSVLKEYRRDSTHFDKIIDQLKAKNMFVCPTLSFYYIWGMQYTKKELNERNGLDKVDAELKGSWNKSFSDYMDQFNTPTRETERDKAILKSKKNLSDFGRVLKILSDKGVALLLSPDESAFNVPGYAMAEEMKLYSKAGINNERILKICTANAARFFGTQEWGSITKGKQANLVILDEDPLKDIGNVRSVYGTILDGKFYKPEVLLKN